MKEEVVCAIEKASHLKTLKLDDDNLYKKTDLGFKAENILSSTLLTRESSLRSKARKLLIEVCERLIKKKTPLAFPVANYVSCLNPMLIFWRENNLLRWGFFLLLSCLHVHLFPLSYFFFSHVCFIIYRNNAWKSTFKPPSSISLTRLHKVHSHTRVLVYTLLGYVYTEVT